MCKQIDNGDLLLIPSIRIALLIFAEEGSQGNQHSNQEESCWENTAGGREWRRKRWIRRGRALMGSSTGHCTGIVRAPCLPQGAIKPSKNMIGWAYKSERSNFEPCECSSMMLVPRHKVLGYFFHLDCALHTVVQPLLWKIIQACSK